MQSYQQNLFPQNVQYREFHDSLIQVSPLSQGRIVSGQYYCPDAPVADKPSIEGCKYMQGGPRPSYANFEIQQHASVRLAPVNATHVNRISYNVFGRGGSLMNGTAASSLGYGGNRGTSTSIQIGTNYTRSLGGVQWMDAERVQGNEVVGVHNLMLGEEASPTCFPYSARATRASYGELEIVGQKFWRDPATSNGWW